MDENDSGWYGQSLELISRDIKFLLLTCLLCYFCLQWSWMIFLTMGKRAASGHRERAFTTPNREVPFAAHRAGQDTHMHAPARAHTDAHTHQLQWPGDYAGEMDTLVLLAVLAGMNANQYNAYEGAIWQHTGKVFKISYCGSCKSTIKKTIR